MTIHQKKSKVMSFMYNTIMYNTIIFKYRKTNIYNEIFCILQKPKDVKINVLQAQFGYHYLIMSNKIFNEHQTFLTNTPSLNLQERNETNMSGKLYVKYIYIYIYL